MGTHLKCLSEALLRMHSISFCGEIRKMYDSTFLSEKVSYQELCFKF